MNTLISVQDLKVSFRLSKTAVGQAVKGVSIEVRAGEVVTIIGATTPEQLRDTLAAADVTLAADVLTACHQVTKEILYPMG